MSKNFKIIWWYSITTFYCVIAITSIIKHIEFNIYLCMYLVLVPFILIFLDPRERKEKWKEIKSEKEYDKAIKRIDKIFDAKPNTKEFDELELLAKLVSDYEEKYHNIEN